MSKCRETSNDVKYMCTAVSLGIDKMMILVKLMKQVKIIKLVIMRLRSVPGSQRTKVSLKLPRTEVRLFLLLF